MEEERGQERQLFYKIAVIVIIFIDQSHMADVCVCVCVGVCVCERLRERGHREGATPTQPVRSTGEGNGKPLHYSCLEKPMNRMKRQKRYDTER